MGAVRRAFGSLLALGARHAGGPASGDVAPRLGTRLASLRAVHTRGDYLGSMGAPIVGGSLPGGMGNPSRLDRVPRERRRVYNARAWAATSDHWRGLATVAGEDDDGGDGAGLAPDDSDDEAPPADADEEEDIAAFHDSLDDDTDDATGPKVKFQDCFEVRCGQFGSGDEYCRYSPHVVTCCSCTLEELEASCGYHTGCGHNSKLQPLLRGCSIAHLQRA